MWLVVIYLVCIIIIIISLFTFSHFGALEEKHRGKSHQNRESTPPAAAATVRYYLRLLDGCGGPTPLSLSHTHTHTLASPSPNAARLQRTSCVCSLKVTRVALLLCTLSNVLVCFFSLFFFLSFLIHLLLQPPVSHSVSCLIY